MSCRFSDSFPTSLNDRLGGNAVDPTTRRTGGLCTSPGSFEPTMKVHTGEQPVCGDTYGTKCQCGRHCRCGGKCRCRCQCRCGCCCENNDSDDNFGDRFDDNDDCFCNN